MKNKFKIIDASTGEKLKLKEGEMVVMNENGVFILMSTADGWSVGMSNLSDLYKYRVVWKSKGEKK